MYHSVEHIPGDPDHDLVAAMAAGLFEQQLRHLRAHYKVVPAGELVSAVNERRRGERFPVAVTLDDDCRSHITVVLPILKRVGVPATFFLTGAALRQPRSFWWERLARVSRHSGADVAELLWGPSARGRHSMREIGSQVRNLDPEARLAIEAQIAQVAGDDPSDAGLRVEDVQELAKAGMELGFHTLRHDNLVLMDDEALGRAMVDGREELEAIAGRLATICYPYGQVDKRVADVARAEFDYGFTTEHAAVTASHDSLLCPRVAASHASVGVVAARIVIALVRARAKGVQ